jgi:hypothetical protein
MRKLLAIVVMLFCGLAFVGQTLASASAGYSDCCLQGCEGMARCANAACQACAAPQPAPMVAQLPAPVTGEPQWLSAHFSFDAGLRPEPWTPPD